MFILLQGYICICVCFIMFTVDRLYANSIEVLCEMFVCVDIPTVWCTTSKKDMSIYLVYFPNKSHLTYLQYIYIMFPSAQWFRKTFVQIGISLDSLVAFQATCPWFAWPLGCLNQWQEHLENDGGQQPGHEVNGYQTDGVLFYISTHGKWHFANKKIWYMRPIVIQTNSRLN